MRSYDCAKMAKTNLNPKPNTESKLNILGAQNRRPKCFGPRANLRFLV